MKWAPLAHATVPRASAGILVAATGGNDTWPLCPSASPSFPVLGSFSLNDGPVRNINNCLIQPLLEQIINTEYAAQRALWRGVWSSLPKANADLLYCFWILSKHGWCSVSELSCLIAEAFLAGLKISTSSYTLSEVRPGSQIAMLISLWNWPVEMKGQKLSFA